MRPIGIFHLKGLYIRMIFRNVIFLLKLNSEETGSNLKSSVSYIFKNKIFPKGFLNFLKSPISERKLYILSMKS